MSAVDELERVEEDSPPDISDTSSRPRAVRGLVAVLIGLATAAVIAAGVAAFLDRRDTQQADRDRQAVVDVASQQAVTLLTIDAENVEDSVSKLLDASTGDFHRQLQGIEQSFGDLVRQGNVDSTGEVVSAAVSELHGDKAVVLLALSANVQNSETTKPEGRDYRILVDLTREGKTWLVSNMQFVA